VLQFSCSCTVRRKGKVHPGPLYQNGTIHNYEGWRQTFYINIRSKRPEKEISHPDSKNTLFVRPYGENEYPGGLVPSMLFVKEGYIIVYQDVRGRWMSEGNFVDIRPHNPDKKSKNDIDESSDTYDTVEWLLKNIPANNGKVGIYGISYPGFYASASLPGAHPAVKAVSPQAPVTDWFIGDDFHHNGAFMLIDAFTFYSSFGVPRPKANYSRPWTRTISILYSG